MLLPWLTDEVVLYLPIKGPKKSVNIFPLFKLCY